MKSGYDQFFKDARKASMGAQGAPQPAKKFSVKEKASTRFGLSEKDVEERLRHKVGVKARRAKKKGTPWALVLFSLAGVVLAGVGMVHADRVEALLKNIEVSMIGFASAEPSPDKAPAAASADAPPAEKKESAAPVARSVSSSSDLDHLSKLSDRQKQLDARANELNAQEAEVNKMKAEIEKRMKELEAMRAQISDILAERVKVDAERVETLVQMYSNMKPPQAAKVFETLDEDLAIEILSRMKKKNAADIMNLLPPEKAQIFSERFAGYKRK